MTGSGSDQISLDELFAAVGVSVPQPKEASGHEDEAPQRASSKDTNEQELLGALGIPHIGSFQKREAAEASVDADGMDRQDYRTEQKSRARQWRQELQEAGERTTSAASQDAASGDARTQPVQASVASLPSLTANAIRPFGEGAEAGSKIGVLEDARAQAPEQQTSGKRSAVPSGQQGWAPPDPRTMRPIQSAQQPMRPVQADLAQQPSSQMPHPGMRQGFPQQAQAAFQQVQQASLPQLQPVDKPIAPIDQQTASQPQLSQKPLVPSSEVGHLHSVEQQVIQQGAPHAQAQPFAPQPMASSFAQQPQGQQHAQQPFQVAVASAWQQQMEQAAQMQGTEALEASEQRTPQPSEGIDSGAGHPSAQADGPSQGEWADVASADEAILDAQSFAAAAPLADEPFSGDAQHAQMQEQAEGQPTEALPEQSGYDGIREGAAREEGGFPPFEHAPSMRPFDAPQMQPLSPMPAPMAPHELQGGEDLVLVQAPASSDALEDLEKEARSSKVAHVVGGILIAVAVACVAVAICLLTGIIDLSAFNPNHSAQTTATNTQISSQAAPSATSDDADASDQPAMTTQSGSKSGQVVYSYVVRGVDGGTHEALETATFGEDGKLTSSVLEIQSDSQMDSEKLLDQLRQQFGDSLTEGTASEDKVVCTVTLPRDDLDRESYTELLSTNAPEFKIVSQ